MSFTIERRKKLFSPSQTNDFKRRLQQSAINIRKNHRAAFITSKRLLNSSTSDLSGSSEFPQNTSLRNLVNDLASSPSAEHTTSTLSSIRQIINQNSSELFSYALELSLLSYLTPLLNPSFPDDVLKETAWIISTLAMSDLFTPLLQSLPVLQSLVQMIHPGKPVPSEYSLWALSNIAVDNDTSYDLLHKIGLIDLLYDLLKSECPLPLLKAISRVLSILYSPRHSPEKVIEICSFFLSFQDTDLLSSTLDILYHVSLDSLHIDLLQESGLLKLSVKLVKHFNYKIQNKALLISANISASTSSFTLDLLDYGILNNIHYCLMSNSSELKKQALFTISNILAEGNDRIACVMDHPVMWECFRALGEGEYLLQIESSFVLRNLAYKADEESLKLFLSLEVFDILFKSLKQKHSDICINVLGFLESLMRLEEDSFEALLRESGCLDELRVLEEHRNRKVSEKARSIIEEFYNFE